jgi:hypothetical protein
MLLVAAMLACFGAHDASAQSPAPADPYARYTHPGQCVQAAERLSQLYWRDKRADTLVDRPLTDTVPTVVVDAARACATRFSLATAPIADLPDLVALYLWTRQDSLASAAATRLLDAPANQLATQSGWADRGWRLLMVVRRALSARPVRIDLVKRYLHELDTIRAPSAAPWRMLAYKDFARMALRSGNLTVAHDAVRAAISASQTMVRSEQIDRVYEILEAYDILAEPTSLLASGPAAVAVFDTARTRLLPLRGPGTWGGGAAAPDESSALDNMMRQALGMGEPPPPVNRDVMEQQRLQGYIAQLEMPYKMVGNAAPPLTATHWYPVSDDTVARPRRGVVTLVVSVNANCGGGCYSQYAVLRRLQAAYAARGLQIVMLASTHGYFRNQPEPLPAHEAEQSRHYVLDFLKLPGVLGVEETKFSFRDDGMRLNMPGETPQGYFRGRDAVVVGKDGLVRQVVTLWPWREQMVRDVIEAALGK